MRYCPVCAVMCVYVCCCALCAAVPCVLLCHVCIYLLHSTHRAKERCCVCAVCVYVCCCPLCAAVPCVPLAHRTQHNTHASHNTSHTQHRHFTYIHTQHTHSTHTAYSTGFSHKHRDIHPHIHTRRHTEAHLGHTFTHTGRCTHTHTCTHTQRHGVAYVYWCVCCAYVWMMGALGIWKCTQLLCPCFYRDRWRWRSRRCSRGGSSWGRWDTSASTQTLVHGAHTHTYTDYWACTHTLHTHILQWINIFNVEVTHIFHWINLLT